MRPKWFVWENVPGVFSTNEGNDFKEFIRQIDEIGYHVAWRVLDAQYVRVDGFPRAVPQRRRRVFAVGHIGGWEYPAEVLFEPSCLQRNTPPCRVKGKGFTADLKRSVGMERTVRMRAGCDGRGKGALVSHERSLTLAAAGNDQVVFIGRDIGGGSKNLAILIGNGQVDNLINTPELAQTLNCMHDQQAVLCLNDQGGSVMQIEQNGNAGTLRANTHGNEQIVCVYGAENPIYNTEHSNPVTCNHNGLENVIACNSKKMGLDIGFDVQATLNATDYNEPQVVCYENHANDSRVTLMGDSCHTLSSRMGTDGGNLPLVQECYAIDSIASNSMKSSNPHSGFHKEDIAKTIDTTNPNPVKKQGGNVIVESVAIAENIIGRQVQNGGNGIGVQVELAYTQNTSGVMGVGTNTTVRRLLPVEYERLMGFPDNWTRISWKGKPEEECPDNPRYKACGNSMCVNVMRWLGMRIENIERKMK
jgi:site-specific DNA-cytosine methylase